MKKIVHLCLASIFSDHFSYQENMIPKFHQALGYSVEVIASLEVFDKDGKYSIYQGEKSYRNEYDIPVRRLPYRDPMKIYRTLRRFVALAESLEAAAPDILFIHGCQFLDIDVVARYAKKHPGLTIYVDNHADSHNSAKNFLSRNILHKIVWKRCAQKIEPYTTKFYGVTPIRVDFLKEVYRLPAEKCTLLELGADDDAVEAALKPDVRIDRRKDYGVSDDDIVIVTGGKIDANKPQVMTLMKAIGLIDDPHIKLIVFGSVAPEYKEEFNASLGDRVRFIGWRRSEEIYADFAAADLVAFPGLHSVLWEQAVGMGKPCLFRRIEGFEHIDLGGNCLFFKDDSAESYAASLREAIGQLDRLKAVAAEKGKETFSYRKIAVRALEG